MTNWLLGFGALLVIAAWSLVPLVQLNTRLLRTSCCPASIFTGRRIQNVAPSPAVEVEESEVLIAKHRNGPTGTVRLGFMRKFATFTELDDIHRE